MLKCFATGTSTFGEARIEFHVTTDSHEQISSDLSACKESCTSFGRALQKLVFTDDLYRDKIFFNEIIPNLQDTSNAYSSNFTNAIEILAEDTHIN